MTRKPDWTICGIKEAIKGGAGCAARSPADAQISIRETFGPGVAIYRYGDLNEEIARANSLPTVFPTNVFSQNIDVAIYAADRLDALAVMINDPTTFRTDWRPFSGRKESGNGTGGIPHTVRDMTREKLIALRSSSRYSNADKTVV